MYLTRCFLLILVILTYQTVANCLFEGELCHHQKVNTTGVCKLLKDCPYARQNLSATEYPQNCGFQGNLAIVCCPQIGTTTPTTTTTITTTTIITSTTSTTITPTTSTTITPTISTTITPTITSLTRMIGPLLVGERAKRACEEYKKLPYPPGINRYVLYDPHIFMGTPATRGEIPHMALIGYGTFDNYEYKCGGSLISDKFVLTAAHCLFARGLGEPQIVRLGDLNYTDPNDDQYVQQIKIKTLHKHPDYKPSPRYNDIALLELEKPATLHVYVKPACPQVDKFNYPKGFIAGWGHTEHGKPSEHLLEATVERFPPEICNKTYNNNKRLFPRGIDDNLQICYGSNTNSTDTCQGDSGGPIQMYAGNVCCNYYIFGITSFGISCGHKTIPSVYVRVSYYIEWLEDIVWP